MAERTKRQNEIVAKMIEDALVSAAEFERECAAFAATQEISDIGDVIDELCEWLEERDGDRLEAFGIVMEEGVNGCLLFRMAEKSDPFVVRARGDLTIAVGGQIVDLNPDLPIMDEDVYAEVLDRIMVWAGVSNAGRRKRLG